MAFGDSLVAYLKNESAITALVGSGTRARIRPNKLDESDVLPALRYFISASQSVEHLLGSSGLTIDELQIDCYAYTREQAWELSEAVRAALQGYRSAYMGDVWIHGFSLNSRLWEYEQPIDASDRGAHRVVMSFSVAYGEDAVNPTEED